MEGPFCNLHQDKADYYRLRGHYCRKNSKCMSESFLRYLRHFLKETEETRDKAKDYLKESTFFAKDTWTEQSSIFKH